MKYSISFIFLLIAGQAMVGMTSTQGPTFRQAIQQSLKRQRSEDFLSPTRLAPCAQPTPEEVAALLEAEREFEKRNRIQSASQPTADEIAAYIQLEHDVEKRRQDAVSPEEIAALLAVEAKIQEENDDFYKQVAEVADALEIELRSQSQDQPRAHDVDDQEFYIEVAKLADAIEADRLFAERAEGDEYWNWLAYHESRVGYQETLSQLASSPEVDKARLQKRLTEVERVLIDSLEYFIQSSSVSLLKDIVSQESCRKILRSLPDKSRMGLLHSALGRLRNVPAPQKKDALLAASHLVGAARKFPQHYFTNSVRSISPMPLLEMLIDAEEESIKGACFDVNNQSIMQALRKKAAQGVPVTLILDKQNRRKYSAAMNSLRKSGVTLWYRQFPGHGITHMHEKFMLFGKNPALGSLVWHGSMNWTNNATRNDENAILAKKSHSIQAFSQRFQELSDHSNS